MCLLQIGLIQKKLDLKLYQDNEGYIKDVCHLKFTPLQWNNLRIIYNKYVMHIKQKPFNNFTNKILLLF